MPIDYEQMAFPKHARKKSKPALRAARSAKCELCGKMAKPVHRHHIKTRGAGGDDCSENLIDLCPTCHRLVHDGMIAKKDLTKIVKQRTVSGHD